MSSVTTQLADALRAIVAAEDALRPVKVSEINACRDALAAYDAPQPPTNDKVRVYLEARARILAQQNDVYVARSQDRRCSHHTRKEWEDCAAFARDELRIVREALAEPPRPRRARLRGA